MYHTDRIVPKGNRVFKKTADNLVRQNKNRFMVWYSARCLLELEDKVTLQFLLAYYTKNFFDGSFCLVKWQLKGTDVLTSADMRRTYLKFSHKIKYALGKILRIIYCNSLKSRRVQNISYSFDILLHYQTWKFHGEKAILML